jgi:hypothetical protein
MNWLSKTLAVFDGLVLSIISWYKQDAMPTAPLTSNLETLIEIMKAQEMNEGPMPGTGGVIHVDTDAVTRQIAALIIKYAQKYTLGLPTLRERIALMTAWIRAESDYDPGAVDPNEENWSKNPTADELLDNLDLGLAQFSWRTLVAMACFKGMTVAAIKEKATDPEWSVEAMFAFCDDLLRQARVALLADSTLLQKVPNGDWVYVGVQSYNTGPSGTISMMRAKGILGNWRYARAVLARRDAWLPLFT